jgi:hypothetical protein
MLANLLAIACHTIIRGMRRRSSRATAPTPDEFRAAIASGRFRPTGPETLYVLGKMFLAGFLSGLSDPRFEEALVVARQG